MNAKHIQELIKKIEKFDNTPPKKVIEWLEFEKIIAEIYKSMGYTVHHQIQVYGSAPRYWHLPEFRIDVLASKNLGFHNIRVIVECKYWNKKVTPDIIRSFKQILTNTQYEKAVIISKKGFTKESIIEAADSNTQLISKSELLDFLRFNILINNYRSQPNINSKEKNSLEDIFKTQDVLLTFNDFHNIERYKKEEERKRYRDLLGNMIEYAKKRKLLINGFGVELLIKYGELHRRESLELNKAKVQLNEAYNKIKSNDKQLKRFEGKVLYELAYVDFLNNDYKKSSENFIKSSKADDNYGDLVGSKISRTQAAVAIMRNGKFEEAHEILIEGLDFFKASPHNIDCMRWKANCLCHLAQLYLLHPIDMPPLSVKKCIKKAKNILSNIDVSTWIPDHLEGQYHYKNKNYISAIKCLSNIIEGEKNKKIIIKERFAEILCARGRAFEKSNHNRKAKRDYIIAMEKCPIQRANGPGLIAVEHYYEGLTVPKDEYYAKAYINVLA